MEVIKLRLAVLDEHDNELGYVDLMGTVEMLHSLIEPKDWFDQAMRALGQQLWHEYVSPRLAVDGPPA